MKRSIQFAFVLILTLMMGVYALAATIQPHTRYSTKKKTSSSVTETSHAARRKTTLSHSRRQVKARASRTARRRYYERFTGHSFIDGWTSRQERS